MSRISLEAGINEIFAPWVESYGFAVEFEEDDDSWTLDLQGKEFRITLWGYQSYRDPDVSIRVHVDRELIRPSIEARYQAIIDDADLSLARVLRAYRGSWWSRFRYWWMVRWPGRTHVITQCEYVRGLDKRSLRPLFQGNLVPIFAEYRRDALLEVFDQVQKPAQELAEKYDLTVSFEASDTWRIKFRKRELDLMVYITCASAMIGAVGRLQLHDDHNRDMDLDQLPNFDSESQDRKDLDRDYKEVIWTVPEVSRKLENLIRLVDKYVGPYFTGELPLDIPDRSKHGSVGFRLP